MSLVDSLKRPEYTGQNRCLPCTVVNSVIVLVVALALGIFSPFVGLVVLVGGALAVYLRGYVVPGTPEFAPQLVAAVGLSHVFGHDDEGELRESESLTADVNPEVMLSTLLDAGVLYEEEDGLYLADHVREDWEETMATLRKADDEELADTVSTAVPFDAEVSPQFDGIGIDGPDMSVWMSRAQAIADVATIFALSEQGVPASIRLAATEPMRMFVEVCPDCGGPVEETTVRNCCGGTAGLYDSPEHAVLACSECDAVVYELDE
ncbi:hypothetical protein ACFQJC_01235 [Haloferax namakaokahaiae]|uniref:Uncharacterized protein n=1 Tax=Haloferax namakaokahaiae TaxID=1748331 RepID=A0ABD5ZAW8_9EURY